MNAPAKVETNPNMTIWDAVSRTDPAHTKKVNQRGGFTAISAHYQVMEATRQFGPVGIGWGYENGAPIIAEGAIFIPVTLWHGERSNSFGPIYGGADLFDSRGKVDSDAAKKAATDGLTKGLSQLGFNADVFLGRFDDNKYVEEMRREFSGPPANGDNGKGSSKEAGKDDPFPQGPCKNKTELKTTAREFWRDVEACGDDDQLSALIATNGPLIKQLKAALPDWWEGRDSGNMPFEGLGSVITKKQTEFAADVAGEPPHPFAGG